MNWIDIAHMAIHNLWQRRLRTSLNLTGIVIGCIILLMTAAGAGGVRDAFQMLFDSSEFARQIGVFSGRQRADDPPEGTIIVEAEMSDERRERIEKALTDEWKRANARGSEWKMTPDELAAMSRIPNVSSVVPEIYLRATVAIGDDQAVGTVTGVDVNSSRERRRIIAGKMLTEESRDDMLVDEFFAYRLGYQSDQQLEDLIGRDVSIQYRISGSQFSTIYNVLTRQWGDLSQEDFLKQAKFMEAFVRLIGDLDSTSLSDDQKQLIRSLVNEATDVQPKTDALTITRTFRVRGVVRKGRDESISNLFRRYFHDVSSGGVMLHHKVAADLQLADPEQDQFYQALVTVDSTQHLQSVTDAIEEMGGSAESGVWLLENINRQIDRSAWVVYGIAAAVLLTAAIGISNTLIISVMERTPEFGIMKSLGAKDSHLLLLMVCEGATLGVLGAVIAVMISWLLAFAGDRILESYIEMQSNSDLNGNLFQFSTLPALGVVIISVLICVGASILPAWRAARLDPVAAMRRT